MLREELSSSEVYLQDKLVLKKGQKYLFRAQSGHGKTSILNFIYGCNLNYEGTVHYVNEGKEEGILNCRKTRLSYVFQDFKLFPDLSIYENIQLKNTLTNHQSAATIEAWLEKVNLAHRRDQLVRTLSLGQCQRTAILRALCQPFDFLLLDEPFSHLDEKNSCLIRDLIVQEIARQDAGMVLTSLGGDEHLFEFNHILNL